MYDAQLWKSFPEMIDQFFRFFDGDELFGGNAAFKDGLGDGACSGAQFNDRALGAGLDKGGHSAGQKEGTREGGSGPAWVGD